MNPSEVVYASLGRRTLAALLDNLTWLLFYSFFYAYLVAGADAVSETAGIVVGLVFLSAWFNYFAFSEWRWGQTIGKNATGIEVRSVDGEKLSFLRQTSVRNILRLIDFFLVGWVMISRTERRQRLGDKAAKTIVVRTAPKTTSAAARGSAPPVTRPAVTQSAAASPNPGPAVAGMPGVQWSMSQTWWWLLGGLFLAFFLAPLLILPFDPDLADPDSATKGGILAAQALLALVLTVIAVGVASGWKLGQVRDALRRLGLGKYEPSMIGVALGAWFAYFVAAVLFSAFVLQPEQEDISGELGVGDPNVLVAVLAVALIAIAAPFSEELFFRGFFFGGLRGRWPLWPAAIVAGLIFGLIHAPTGITTVIPLAGLGILLCWLYDYTGSLWPCVMVHVINNGLALALSPLAEDVFRPLIG
jgi:membrane protease YdiL (CAAX protease family)/uncharacterized RDD family membrane protein YckC